MILRTRDLLELTGTILRGKFLKDSFFFVTLLLLGQPLFAASNALSNSNLTQNARSSDYYGAGLIVKSLSYACLGLEVSTDSIDCNPAMTVLNPESHLSGSFLLANGYANAERANKILSGKLDQNMVDDLFKGERVVQSEMNLEILFKAKYFEASYVPSSLRYLTVTRNEANPDISMNLVKDEVFTAQAGYQFYNDLLFGLRTRIISRQYIKKTIHLYDLATESGKEQLKPMKENLTLLEPAATYYLPLAWRSSFTVLLANNGEISGDTDNYPVPPEAQFGFAINPPVRYGLLTLLFDYRTLNIEDTRSEDKAHWGLNYHLGNMTVASGVDVHGFSLGIFSFIKQLNTGISFSTTKSPWSDNDTYMQTVYLQMGCQL